MHEDWPEATATITLCVIHSHIRCHGRFSNYMVAFTYVVNGITYDGAFDCVDGMQKGENFPIRYNPDNPARNNTEIAGNWASWCSWTFSAVMIAMLLYLWLNR